MIPPRQVGGRPGRAAMVLFASLALAPWAWAAEQGYTLQIPDGQPVSFELDFAVQHPGTLGVRAEWSAPRVLAFRLYGPGGDEHRARRSGPSPQRFEVPVEPRDVERGASWRLSIRALPGREGGEGVLTLELPDPPEVVARQEEPPPPPPPPAPDAWRVARRAPFGARAPVAHLYGTVERFRDLVTDDGGAGTADGCRWQDDTLRWVSAWRDRYVERGELPDIATRRYLRRIVESIRAVDTVRLAEDPILAGPPPKDSMRRRAWDSVRSRRIDAIERELDRSLDMLRSGHAPRLEDETWPARLLTCVAACERYFEQRVRLGEHRADNAEIASSQWEAILAAGEVLESLAFLAAPGPGDRASRR